jgi:hypothetical protein
VRDFFRCAARLVVTIYDLLLASILGVRGRLASVAYPFTYRRRAEARDGLQAAGLGVFPSFIAAIFIDDVLRSLITPICFNLCKMTG